MRVLALILGVMVTITVATPMDLQLLEDRDDDVPSTPKPGECPPDFPRSDFIVDPNQPGCSPPPECINQTCNWVAPPECKKPPPPCPDGLVTKPPQGCTWLQDTWNGGSIFQTGGAMCQQPGIAGACWICYEYGGLRPDNQVKWCRCGDIKVPQLDIDFRK